MISRAASARPVVFLLGCVVLAGCGKQEERLVPVEGTVYFDGAPVKGGPRAYVVLQPDRSKGNENPNEPSATIAEDGTYKLTTIARDGARPGWYHVRVAVAEVIDPKNPYFTKWLVPEKFADFATSGLVMEVREEPAPPGTYDLHVSSKKK